EFCSFSKLCSPDDRVVNKQQALVFDEGFHRDQLHPGDQVSLLLSARHEGTGPGRSIFNKWAGEGNAGFIGISNSMGSSGVRHSCYQVRLYMFSLGVSLSQPLSAFITHVLYI